VNFISTSVALPIREPSTNKARFLPKCHKSPHLSTCFEDHSSKCIIVVELSSSNLFTFLSFAKKPNGGDRRRRRWRIPVQAELNKNGVEILINKSLKSGVVDIKRCGDQIILVKLVFGDLVLNVISAYVLQVGHNENTSRTWLGVYRVARSSS
jgi:hypothetical protein